MFMIFSNVGDRRLFWKNTDLRINPNSIPYPVIESVTLTPDFVLSKHADSHSD